MEHEERALVGAAAAAETSGGPAEHLSRGESQPAPDEPVSPTQDFVPPEAHRAEGPGIVAAPE
eukprot:11102011-Alexandrium_andersonii.AAC.1